MKITSIYTNSSISGKKKYFMRIETSLFSIIEISRLAYSLLRMSAVNSGWEIIECVNDNETVKPL